MLGHGSPIAETRPAGPLGGRYYRPELDALRFFAFLCVFFFHAGAYVSVDPVKYEWLSRVRAVGLFGVPIFFLLSAFLITELLFRERERTGRIHIPSFYMRSILRIWPLYFTAFFGLAFLNYVWPGIGTDNHHAWMAFTFLCGNWYIFHHGWLAPSIDPLWSVSIEEQFYLIIPLLAARGGRQAVKIAGWVLVALAYIAVVNYALHPNALEEWTNSLVQFQFFCAGTLIALYLRGRTLPLAISVRVVGIAAGLLFWLGAVVILPTEAHHASASNSIAGWVLTLTGTIVLFLCTLGTPARLVPSWLAYFGRISYGLYIVHAFVFFVVFLITSHFSLGLHPQSRVLSFAYKSFKIIAALTIDLIVAHFSFAYFESYFLSLKKRFTFVASRD